MTITTLQHYNLEGPEPADGSWTLTARKYDGKYEVIATWFKGDRIVAQTQRKYFERTNAYEAIAKSLKGLEDEGWAVKL